MQAAVFDLDGVIVDSERIHSRAFETVLRGYITELPSGKRGLIHEIGISEKENWRQLVRDYQLDVDVDELVQERRKIYPDLMREAELLPGVRELLMEIIGQDVALAIASSTSLENIETVLKTHELRTFFDAIVSADQVSSGKPDPKIYLEAAQRLNASPQLCVAFEDSATGVRAAVEAGMFVVAVPVYVSENDVEEADVVLKSLKGVRWGDLCEKARFSGVLNRKETPFLVAPYAKRVGQEFVFAVQRRKKTPRVFVVGDTPWDQFWIGRPAQTYQSHSKSGLEYPQLRISEKTKQYGRPGTVFAVAKVLREFGAEVVVLTWTGHDDHGESIRREYIDLGVKLVDIRLDCPTCVHHFILRAVPGETRDGGGLEVILRMNYEDEAVGVRFQGNGSSADWKPRVCAALQSSDYVVINDIHRGTLSWIADSGSADSSEALQLIREQYDHLGYDRPVTILDVRKSLTPYASLPIDVLAASGYEIAGFLNPRWIQRSDIDDVAGYGLDEEEFIKLIERFPQIGMVSLTRGWKGVQLGVKTNRGMICVSDIEAFTSESQSVTPHAGDFFDAGLVLGHWTSQRFQDAVLLAQTLASCQVEFGGVEIVNFETALSQLENNVFPRKDSRVISKFEIEESRSNRVLAVLEHVRSESVIDLERNQLGNLFACFHLGEMYRRLKTLTQSYGEGEKTLLVVSGETGACKTDFAQALGVEILASRELTLEQAKIAVVDKCTKKWSDVFGDPDPRESLSQMLSETAEYGVLLIDEFRENQEAGQALLELIDSPKFFGKAKLIVVGSALVGMSKASENPWADLVSRAHDFVEMPAWKGDAIEDFPYWFAKACEWSLADGQPGLKPEIQLTVELSALHHLMIQFEAIENAVKKKNYRVLDTLLSPDGVQWRNGLTLKAVRQFTERLGIPSPSASVEPPSGFSVRVPVRLPPPNSA